MRCDFGIDINQRPCSDANCAVCSICATSFDFRHATGEREGAGSSRAEYGHGLYFTKVSSLANEWARSTSRQRPQGLSRCVLPVLCCGQGRGSCDASAWLVTQVSRCKCHKCERHRPTSVSDIWQAPLSQV
jgi:hypothetical protein